MPLGRGTYPRVLLIFFLVLFSVVGFTLFATDYPKFSRVKSLVHGWTSHLPSANLSSPIPSSPPKDIDPAEPSSAFEAPLKHGNDSLLQLGQTYVKAILTPEDKSFPRLECPAPSGDRYSYLRGSGKIESPESVRPRYFFALDLHQCIDVLPRLFGSIIESIRYLGPENCALSVVEGRSTDGTFEVLKLLRTELEPIGVKYFLKSSEINPGGENTPDRIKALAELRNIALQPLVAHPDQYASNVTVVFINDVAICMEDILELVHQRLHQKADMTCAMDWTFVGPDPTFYDVWIARGMNGDSFFNIPADGNWNSAWNLFWNNPEAQQHQRSGQPFQVFSCWNGAVAFTAKPLTEQKIKFRAAYDSECFQGEPKIFCREMWQQGYGKIAVIPSVNLEYSDEAAKKIKAQKGYVSKWVEQEPTMIDWNSEPPLQVKCIPTYGNQTWLPWDERPQGPRRRNRFHR